jgi:hypothetical protein
MHGMPRPLLKTLTLALLLALAATAQASATTVAIKPADAKRASVAANAKKPPASVKLRSCRSGAYYDNRAISFRVRMARIGIADAPQNLRMRFEVLQRLKENRRFKKLKADGLGNWFSSGDSATIYQRDVALTDVETAATDRAKVSFRWVAADGTIKARRVLVSKSCKQKVGLPKLKITNDTAVPIIGSTALMHTVTIANDGRSEAVDLPVGIRVDALDPVISTIDSIGPDQSVDVQIQAPACQLSASAVIDPLRQLVRIPRHTRTPFPDARCS